MSYIVTIEESLPLMHKRKTFNPKRRLQKDCDPIELERLAQKVRYGGNPEHKKNPGDFGLNPPVAPRPDKTLCDMAGVFDKKTAVALLKQGIRRGLIAEHRRGEYPRNVWAVTEGGQPMEAQLENEAQGVYHGYPMPKTDPFQEQVLERWERSS
jgi:hypothetical protein